MNADRELIRFAIPAGLLLIAVVAGLLFRSVFMAYIIVPAGLFLWAIWRVITSVDQNLYWLALLVLCSVPALRLILSDNGQTLESAYKDESITTGVVERWRRLVYEAQLGSGERERLVQAMQQLRPTSGEVDDPPELNSDHKQNEKNNDPLSGQVASRIQESDMRQWSLRWSGKPGFLTHAPRWFNRLTLKYRRPDLNWIRETLTALEAEMDIYEG